MLSGLDAVFSLILSIVVGWATGSRAMMIAGAALGLAAAAMAFVAVRRRRGR